MLLGLALLAPVACSDDDDVTAPLGGVDIPRVIVTPGTSTLRPGATVQLAAEVRDGATGDVLAGETVVWASADTMIARVSPSGLVTVVAPGTAGITARYGPAAVGTAAIVVLGPVTAVTVTAAQPSITVGSTTQLTVSAVDAAGVPQARVVTYTSSAPAVATVSSTGIVTGVGAGSATITASSEGQSGTATVTIQPPIAVLLTPAASTVGQGGTQQLTVVLRDPVTGALITGVRPTYTSSNTAVATVSATGLVSLVGPGTATITATHNGRSATVTVTSELTSGTAVTFSGADDDVRNFYINVPAGATRLAVTTAGASTSQDVDIFIFAPGQTDDDDDLCASEGANLNESCTVNGPLAPGLYRIRVDAFSTYTNVTLRATVTP